MPPVAALTETTQQPAKTAAATTTVAATGADQGAADQQKTQAQTEKLTPPEGFSDALKPFWSDEKGVDYAKLGTDLSALTAFKAEQDSHRAQVPEKIEDYEVALPADFKLPDGVTFELKPDDPAITVAREFAKDLGLTKDEFKKVVALKARVDIAEFGRLKEAAAAEMVKLGSKARQRIAAVTAWTNATLGTEFANALLPMMFTAKSIEAFEKVMSVAKGGGPKLTTIGREVSQPDKLTEEQYQALSPTQRIARANDIAAQKRKTG